MNADPCELNNLFDEPSQKPCIRRMADRIRAWQEKTHDTAPLLEV